MAELIKAASVAKSFKNGVDEALIPKRRGRPGINDGQTDRERDQIMKIRPV